MKWYLRWPWQTKVDLVVRARSNYGKHCSFAYPTYIEIIRNGLKMVNKTNIKVRLSETTCVAFAPRRLHLPPESKATDGPPVRRQRSLSPGQTESHASLFAVIKTLPLVCQCVWHWGCHHARMPGNETQPPLLCVYAQVSARPRPSDAAECLCLLGAFCLMLHWIAGGWHGKQLGQTSTVSDHRWIVRTDSDLNAKNGLTRG